MTKSVSSLAELEALLAQRGPGRMVPDLDRITALLDLLGNPQRAYQTIHVTGTNGKTSTSRMVESLLRAHGLRTGRYTSPHLDSVTERIALDGEPIDEKSLLATYQDVAPFAELLDARAAESEGDPITYFELLTALAFAAFADAPVDVAVVEVGLGGRWDATNVIDAPIAVVTPIGLDHQAMLGETLSEIAAEKAGIIASGATVVSAAQSPEAVEPLLRRAVERNATVAREGAEFGVVERGVAVGGQQVTLQGLGGPYPEIFLPLHGAHQAQNAAVALAATEAFFGAGAVKQLDAEVVREAFAEVSSPGRLERVRTSPSILLDAAHNPAGLAVTLAAVAESFGFHRLILVLAVLSDKDALGMLELAEHSVDAVIVTQNSSPRSLPADDLAAMAVDVFGSDRVEVELRLADAIEAAVRLAEEDNLSGDGSPLGGVGVLITGSVVTAADARRLLRR